MFYIPAARPLFFILDIFPPAGGAVEKKEKRATAKATANQQQQKSTDDDSGGGDSDDSDDEESLDIPANKATVVRQPGDGSCLFHSMSYGLGGSNSAKRLRAELEDFIAAHPNEDLNGTPICDWVLWDSQLSAKDYAAKMRDSSDWGGAIEIAVCARIKGVQIDVFERGSQGAFRRISSFKRGATGARSGASDTTKNKAAVVGLLYGGRCHYDAIVVR